MATATIEVYLDGELLSPPYMGVAPVEYEFKPVVTSGSPIGYAWDFGDGGSSVVRQPTHTFENHGHHAVYLTIEEVGSVYTKIKLPYPIALAVLDFDASPRSGEKPLTVEFKNRSYTPTGLQLSDWDWDFGDTQGVTGIQDPTHIYLNDGGYNVTLGAKLT